MKLSVSRVTASTRVPWPDTLSAMRNGAEIILQAALADDLDRACRCIEAGPLKLAAGGWSYEVVDTKLARETKGGTVLQLCLYSDMLGRLRARCRSLPMWSPFSDFEDEAFRFKDYGAYYRQVKLGLATAIASAAPTYPLPVPHCDVCRWRRGVRREASRRRSPLSSCSGYGSPSRRAPARRIGSMTALGAQQLPLGWKPERGSVSTYVRLREQARI